MAPDTKRSINHDDIDRLRTLLKGTNADVHSPADAGYTASVERWSKAAEKSAGVAVAATTSEEVAIAVKYANEQNIDLAVKGGGHSTSGASSTEGGLLIDLGRMQHVQVDPAKQQLVIQGGALWGQADQAAWKHGLATVGGTVADTGVGGLTLGGGYGHLSGKYGLVIDNTVAFTTVFANGEIKKITKDTDPDLFWAMNGAGQNFGVTTEFVLQAYPQDPVFTSTLLFLPTPENITRVVSAVNSIWTVDQNAAPGPTRGRATSICGFIRPPPDANTTMLIMIIVFNGSEQEGRALFQPLYDIGPVVEDSKVVDWPVCNTLAPALYGLRSSMKGSSFRLPLRAEFVIELGAAFDGFLNECADAAASVLAFELIDMGHIARGTQGCFANRGYHLNSLTMPLWRKAENDQKCRQWARDLSEKFKDELERHGEGTSNGVDGGAGVRGGKGAVMLYGNYDQYEEKSRDIFGEHYERLQDLKAQYDPNNLFNKLFAIMPKARTAAS